MLGNHLRPMTRLKVLYVNGCQVGGSLMSTRQLVEAIDPHSLEVALLHGRPGRRLPKLLYRRSTNLEVKLGGRGVAQVIERLNRQIGARVTRTAERPCVVSVSTIVENGARRLLAATSPDVLVVSSLVRHGWRRLRADADRAGVPTVLYLRETDLLPHLDLVAPPDLILANSEALGAAVRARGHEAVVLPSAIDLQPAMIHSTREKVLVVNPQERYGLKVATALAERNPEIGFILQEASALAIGPLAQVRALTAHLPNVEFRRFTETPKEIYRDARLLLAPYSSEFSGARPRTVLESLANGIPVLASDLPGLRETAGAGGRFVSHDAPVEAWDQALRQMWSDDPARDALAVAGRVHAEATLVSPRDAAARFGVEIRRLLHGRLDR